MDLIHSLSYPTLFYEAAVQDADHLFYAYVDQFIFTEPLLEKSKIFTETHSIHLFLTL